MAASALVQVEVAQTIKDDVEKVLAHEGLTLSDAFRIFLVSTAQQQAIPTRALRPNAEILEALDKLDRGEGKRFDSVEALMADLHAKD